MIVQGKYNAAKIFTNNIEQTALDQIGVLLDQESFKDSKIRIMPDAHAGAGCVIGFTANLGDKIIPNIVGVDISCGMLTAKLGKININLEKFDEIIHKYIPSGSNMHEHYVFDYKDEINSLYCIRDICKRQWNAKTWTRQIGTLGGGNHFIELNTDSAKNVYLVIHSGSRHLGKQIAEYYQKLAVALCSGKDKLFEEKEILIKEFKDQGVKDKIQKEIGKLNAKYAHLRPELPFALCYLSGEYSGKYIHDMNIANKFAELNRESMLKIIIDNLFGKNEKVEYFHTTHNYISSRDNIIRKGAVSAYKGEEILIPLNMRDGSLLCKGLGNEDWNYSAPHGSGRRMSRTQAYNSISFEDFKETMKGVYSTTVCKETLDEAPQAYKPSKEIINSISETVEVIERLVPVYNFKATE